MLDVQKLFGRPKTFLDVQKICWTSKKCFGRPTNFLDEKYLLDVQKNKIGRPKTFFGRPKKKCWTSKKIVGRPKKFSGRWTARLLDFDQDLKVTLHPPRFPLKWDLDTFKKSLLIFQIFVKN